MTDGASAESAHLPGGCPPPTKRLIVGVFRVVVGFHRGQPTRQGPSANARRRGGATRTRPRAGAARRRVSRTPRRNGRRRRFSRSSRARARASRCSSFSLFARSLLFSSRRPFSASDDSSRASRGVFVFCCFSLSRSRPGFRGAPAASPPRLRHASTRSGSLRAGAASVANASHRPHRPLSADGVSGARRVVRLGGEDQRGGDVPRGRVSARREPRPSEAATRRTSAANARGSARGRRVQSRRRLRAAEKKKPKPSTNATHIPSRPSTPRRFAPARPRAPTGASSPSPSPTPRPRERRTPRRRRLRRLRQGCLRPRRPPPDERSPRRPFAQGAALIAAATALIEAPLDLARDVQLRAPRRPPGARSTPKRSMRVVATDASLSARKRRDAAPSEAFRSSRSSDDAENSGARNGDPLARVSRRRRRRRRARGKTPTPRPPTPKRDGARARGSHSGARRASGRLGPGVVAPQSPVVRDHRLASSRVVARADPAGAAAPRPPTNPPSAPNAPPRDLAAPRRRRATRGGRTPRPRPRAPPPPRPGPKRPGPDETGSGRVRVRVRVRRPSRGPR